MLSTCFIVTKDGMRRIQETDIPRIQGFYLVGQSFGDLMCMMPTVHKVCRELKRKLDVWTLRPEIFKNDPHVRVVRSCEPQAMQDYVNAGNFLIMCPVRAGNQKSQADSSLIDYAAMNVVMLDEREKRIRLYPDYSERVRVRDLMKLYAQYTKIIVHPNCNFPIRTWPQERWRDLTRRLLEDGYMVITVGRDVENIGAARDSVDKTMTAFDFAGERFLNLINKTSLHELYELMKYVDCVVTVDSGVLHVANATRVPIVALFTEIAPELRVRVRKGTVGYRTKTVYAPCEYQFCSTRFGMRDNRCKQTGEKYLCCMPDVKQVYEKVRESVTQYARNKPQGAVGAHT